MKAMFPTQTKINALNAQTIVNLTSVQQKMKPFAAGVRMATTFMRINVLDAQLVIVRSV
jgi:hypothetical protein